MTVKVGDKFVCERRFGHTPDSSPPRTTWNAAVKRITAKRVYLTGDVWFALDDPERIVKPRYLDYRTRAVPSPSEGPHT